MADRVASRDGRTCRIGVISDTHGRLEEDVMQRLEGVDAVIHAGDVGTPQVLTSLAEIAPVLAVRGNVDRSAWARELPDRRTIEACGRRIMVGHVREEMPAAAEAAQRGFDAVVFGHSHMPLKERRDGVLYLNPGSAGPRRFKLPRAMAVLIAGPLGLEAGLIILEEGNRRPPAGPAAG